MNRTGGLFVQFIPPVNTVSEMWDMMWNRNVWNWEFWIVNLCFMILCVFCLDRYCVKTSINPVFVWCFHTTYSLNLKSPLTSETWASTSPTWLQLSLPLRPLVDVSAQLLLKPGRPFTHCVVISLVCVIGETKDVCEKHVPIAYVKSSVIKFYLISDRLF